MNCVLAVLGISAEWLEREGTLKPILVQVPALGWDTFH